MNELEKRLAFLGSKLASEVASQAMVKEIPAGTLILREEQYVSALPLVLHGLLKVALRFQQRELLLYYIQPQESCIMSFTASLNNEPSKIFAVAEEDSELLLLPVERVPLWLKNYPTLNSLFYQQYNLRYAELLDTIQHLLFDKMDARLLKYLQEKARLTKQQEFKITHGQIANEMGTVREVISRVMKKLENEGKVAQKGNLIKILSL